MQGNRRRHTVAGLVATAVFVAACTGSADGDRDAVSPDEPTEAPQGDADDDAGRAAPEDGGSGAPARFLDGDASELFDQDIVHTFEIELAEEALAELDADPAAEQYVEGALSFDGERLDSIGVRYKGSIGAFIGCTSGPNPFEPTGAKTCTKQSLKLKINWDGASTEFFGQRRIQLHSMNLDPSLMRDRLAYLLFAEAGVPAPRATHARVVVNGEFVGLFALIEQIDGRFTRDRFGDGTGNLYKEVWPFDVDGEVRPAGDFVDGLRTNEADDPSTEIIESFAEEILVAGAATDEDAARRVLSERTDLESFVAYAVVDRAIRHDDGPFHWYCVTEPCVPHNFYLYEEPDTRRIHIIPWDLDSALENWVPETANPITAIADAFGETSNDCEPFAFGGFALLQRSAACDPLIAAWALLDDEFARIDAAFRSGPFSIERVTEHVEAWRDQIAPHVAEAAALHPDAPSVDLWESSVDRLLLDIATEPSRQES